MRMKHAEHGYHNASGSEIEELKKSGWVEVTEDDWKKIIANKNKKEPENIESVIIEPQQEAVKGKPGRKPKHF